MLKNKFMNNYNIIINNLKSLENKANREGMARFGINTERALGIPMPFLRKIGKKYKGDHELANLLWISLFHEARILASIIDDPVRVTPRQMDEWATDFNSWDLCDQCCMNLFVYTAFAIEKAMEWSREKEEFVKRAGFTMMACLALKSKYLKNSDFEHFFPIIVSEAGDDRKMVFKAINWALRQIGKRSLELNEKAIKIAEELTNSGNKNTIWIARDALKELKSNAVRKRIIYNDYE